MRDEVRVAVTVITVLFVLEDAGRQGLPLQGLHALAVRATAELCAAVPGGCSVLCTRMSHS